MNDEWVDALTHLEQARQAALALGGEEAVERIHERGKLTARQRVETLIDSGSFEEIGLLVEGEVPSADGASKKIPADNVVCGWAKIEGRTVCIVADDGTQLGGAGSVVNIEKRFRLRHMAIQHRCPFIGLYEGSAIRFQDSMDAGLMTRIPAFKEVVDCAGVIPQFAAVLGPAYGRPPMDVLYADFSVQASHTGFLALSGPALVAGGIGEQADIDALSGTDMTVRATGLVDRAGADEQECLQLLRQSLSYFPNSCFEAPGRKQPPTSEPPACTKLIDIVPSNLRQPYDMHEVIGVLVDEGSTFEYKPEFGRSAITLLARCNGYVVGIVANQPLHKGGVVDSDACLKMRRFVQLCNAFHMPIVFLEDQPGFMIGTQAESERILFWAAGLLGAVQRASVPKLTVHLRKAHGAAVWTMGGQPDSGDLVYAWPIAIATGTGPASAVNTIHARELAQADDPSARRRELEAQYNQAGSVLRAAKTFGIDDVIRPDETARKIWAWLNLAVRRISDRPGRKALLFP